MTKDEIKKAILATNPSRICLINGEEIELSEAEHDKAINDRVDMEYEQHLAKVAEQEKNQAKQDLLQKLGLTEDEAAVLLG